MSRNAWDSVLIYLTGFIMGLTLGWVVWSLVW